MSGFFGFDAPPVTDFKGAAEATAYGNAIANNAATKANRPTQVTPWGTNSWAQDANGNWTQTQSLNPAMQQTLNTQQATDASLGQKGYDFAQGYQPQQLNTSNFTGLFNLGGPSTVSAPTLASTGADPTWNSVPQIQNAMMARLQPQMDLQRNGEIARLKAQGITEGSEAWNNSMDQLGRSQNDLSMQALLAGSSAANQQFQNTLQRDTFNNSVSNLDFNNRLQSNNQNWNQQIGAVGATGAQRAQQLGEAQVMQQNPLSLIQALRGQSITAPNMPSFVTSGATTGPNYLEASQLTTKQNTALANAQNANKDNKWNGLWNLANLGWNIYKDS